MDSIASKAIQSATESQRAYCKFLFANDSGETGGHQSGILVSRKALPMLFDKASGLAHIEKRNIKILLQNDKETESAFTYYESKGELRMTRFRRGFQYLDKESTGALFVLTQQSNDYYSAFILNTDDEINAFLDAFGMSATETNDLIENEISLPEREKIAFQTFIDGLTVDFPTSEEMSVEARAIQEAIYDHSEYARTKPDTKIIDWTATEYRLFRALEHKRYDGIMSNGFTSGEQFIEVANQVLNRRKSRAGKSLEHHIAAIFDANRIAYEE